MPREIYDLVTTLQIYSENELGSFNETQVCWFISTMKSKKYLYIYKGLHVLIFILMDPGGLTQRISNEETQWKDIITKGELDSG